MLSWVFACRIGVLMKTLHALTSGLALLTASELQGLRMRRPFPELSVRFSGPRWLVRVSHRRSGLMNGHLFDFCIC